MHARLLLAGMLVPRPRAPPDEAPLHKAGQRHTAGRAGLMSAATVAAAAVNQAVSMTTLDARRDDYVALRTTRTAPPTPRRVYSELRQGPDPAVLAEAGSAPQQRWGEFLG